MIRTSLTTLPDPRAWHEERPVYRVNFYTANRFGTFSVEALILHDAESLSEVLEWIDSNRQLRKFELLVEIDGGPSMGENVQRPHGSILLMGENPNA